MQLDLTRYRQPLQHFVRTFQPAEVADSTDAYQIVAPIDPTTGKEKVVESKTEEASKADESADKDAEKKPGGLSKPKKK